MSFDFFTFDNGKDKRRVDYDQFLGGSEKSADKKNYADLQKLLNIFDKDRNGKIDTNIRDGEIVSEAASLFGFVKQMKGDKGLSENPELSAWLREKGIKPEYENTAIQSIETLVENLENGIEVTYKNGEIVKKEKDGEVAEYIYHDAEGKTPAYVEIKVNGGEETLLALSVNVDGTFNDEDFLAKSYTDENGYEVVIERNQQGLITETVKYSDNEAICTVYGTDSVYEWNYFKNILHMEVGQVYTKGNNNYQVSYDNDGHTVTFATKGDTVEKLIEKFGFKDKEEFYALNPKLRGKTIQVSTPVIVPERLSANDAKILNQGSLEQLQKNAQEEYLETIKNEYLPDMVKEIYYSLQEIEGFEVNKDNFILYQVMNGMEPAKQQWVLESIKDRKANGENISPEIIANEIILKEYGADLKSKTKYHFVLPGSEDNWNIKPLTEEQAEVTATGIIRDNLNNANEIFGIYTHAGAVNNFVNWVKEISDSKFSASKINRIIMREDLTRHLLGRCNTDKGLTIKDYYDEKIDLAIRMLPRLKKDAKKTTILKDVITGGGFTALGYDTAASFELKSVEEEIKILKHALEKLTPQELDAFIHKVSEMSDEEYAQSAEPFVEKLIMREVRDESNYSRATDTPLGYVKITKPNSDRNLSISKIKEQVRLYTKMKYEEVFQLELGVPFDYKNIEKYVQKEEQLPYLMAMTNEHEKVMSELTEIRNIIMGVGQGMYHDPKEFEHENARVAELRIASLLKKLYGDDNDKISELLKTFGFDDLSFPGKTLVGFDRELSLKEADSITLSLGNMLTENYENILQGKTLDEHFEELKGLYKNAFGARNAETHAQLFIESQQKGVKAVHTTIDVAGFVMMAAAQFIPVGGQAVSAGLMYSGLTLASLGDVSVSSLENYTKFGGPTKEDEQQMLQELLQGVETGAMILATGGMAKYLRAGGDALVKGGQKLLPELAASNSAKALLTGKEAFATRALNYARGIANSSLTFGAWDTTTAALNYGVFELAGFENEKSIGETVLDSAKHGLMFGAFMGATSPFVHMASNSITKKVFSKATPKIAEASKAAMEKTKTSLVSKASFTGTDVLGTYNTALVSASTTKGAQTFQELTSLVMEVGTFSAYEVANNILESGGKPDGMDWGEWVVGVLQSQAWNLLEIKAMGRVLAAHKVGKANTNFPQKLSPEQELKIIPKKDGMKTKYEVTYPDGKARTVNSMDEVVALSNAHQQQILVYNPMEKLLTQNGSLDFGDGMKLVKDGSTYRVEFSDGRKFESGTLRNVMAIANNEYTLDSYEKTLTEKGKLTLGETEYSYDKDSKQFKTQVNGEIFVAKNFRTLLKDIERSQVVRDLERELNGEEPCAQIAPRTFIYKGEDGKVYILEITKNGESKYLYEGDSVKEGIKKALDLIFGPAKTAEFKPEGPENIEDRAAYKPEESTRAVTEITTEPAEVNPEVKPTVPVNTTKTEVKLATDEDLREIQKIDLEAFEGRYYISSDFAKYKEGLEADGISTYAIKDANGQVIGYYQLEPIEDGELYIHSIAVRSDLRNSKISYNALKQMQENITKFAQENNVKKVTLDVDADKPELVKLYKRFGFEVTGENRGTEAGREYHDLHMEVDVKKVLTEETKTTEFTPAKSEVMPEESAEPVSLRENEPVTPEEARKMLLDAGFTERELESVDFNNKNVLINTTAAVTSIKLRFLEEDMSDTKLRQEILLTIQENILKDREQAGVIRFLNEENANLFKKYLDIEDKESMSKAMGIYSNEFSSELAEKVMQILPILTNNGKEKLSIEQFEDFHFIKEEVIPYLTPENAKYIHDINSKVSKGDKILLNEWDKLFADENLPKDFADRFVAASKRLEELHVAPVKGSKYYSEMAESGLLSDMEKIVEFVDKYKFDFGGTEDNRVSSLHIQEIMTRRDIAALQEFFKDLVPEAKELGLWNLPQEDVSFKDYAELCNYLATEPGLFLDKDTRFNRYNVMNFLNKNGIKDIQGFTKLIKSLKGTSMLTDYASSFIDRIGKVKDGSFEAASKVIDEIKLLPGNNSGIPDYILGSIFNEFETNDIKEMGRRLQYAREHNFSEYISLKEFLDSYLEAKNPDVVQKVELLAKNGITCTYNISRFKFLACTENVSLDQLTAEIDKCINKLDEVRKTLSYDPIKELGEQKYNEILKEIVLSSRGAAVIEDSLRDTGSGNWKFMEKDFCHLFNRAESLNVLGKYWGNPDCKVSHRYIVEMTKMDREEDADLMYKALVDAKAKKHQIKTFDQDLTDSYLEEFFMKDGNFENIARTIALIGLPAFEYSFTSKISGMESLIESTKAVFSRFYYEPERIENLAERLKDKSIEPQERISKLKVLAGLINCCNDSNELQGFIDLIKPSKANEEDVAFAKSLWNNPKFWSSPGDFSEKFEKTYSDFCEHFGVDKNDRKVREFFEKRKTTDSKGNPTHKGVKDSEIRLFLENNIIRKRNQTEWNEEIYKKVFDIAGVEYSPELASKLDLIDSPHLSSIFQSQQNFKTYFKVMLERLNEHPELTTAEIFDQLPQNIETRRQFEERHIPYDRFVNADRESFKTIKVTFSAEKAKDDAVTNLTKEFNDVAFEALPKEETDKIIKALDEIGIKLVPTKVPVYDDAGYLTKEKEVIKLFDAEDKPIEFNTLSKVISAVNKVFNENAFWTTKSADATLQAHKDNFYSHITKDRSQEISSAASMKGERIAELDIHQTDMNNLKMALFLGNGLCCTDVATGCNQFSAPTYCMNKLISAIEITDGKNVVGNTMCYFAEIDGKLTFVLDNIEVQPGYTSATVRDTFMEYAKQLCAEMGLSDIPIYAGPNRHKFTMDDYPMETKDVKIIGSTGDDPIYIDYNGKTYVDGKQYIKYIKMYKIYD